MTRSWRPPVTIGLGVLLVIGLLGGLWLRAASPTPEASCDGVALRPGDDVARALTDGGPGRQFCFAAGRYVLAAPLVPLPGQQLWAAAGATLSGAVTVDRWTRVGSWWRADGFLPVDPLPHGVCVDQTATCRYAETVFSDDQPLHLVADRNRLGPGEVMADYAANHLWVAQDPAGRRLEVARTAAAVTGPASDVVVSGFVIEKFANPAQRGAVEPSGPHWLITDNEIRLNHGQGVQVDADGVTVRSNHLHHNGQLGIGGGPVAEQLVEDNEIDHNNTAGFSPQWEAGGGKWAEARGLTVRANRVHDNRGPGLWTDINCVEVVMEANQVRANTGGGIRHEISFDAVIKGNEVTGNGTVDQFGAWGTAGIEISSSGRVEVVDNTVADNTNGIVLAQQIRRDSPSPLGPHELRDVVVRDNRVVMPQGATGLVNDTGDARYYDQGVRFDGNHYVLPDEAARSFVWRDGYWPWTAWQQTFGQDPAGQFTVSAPPDGSPT